MWKIFSGSTSFSLSYVLNNKNYNFHYILTSKDNIKNFNVIKNFSIKKGICFFQFINNFYYNNKIKYNIYYFIKLKESKIDNIIISDYGFKFSLMFIKYSNFLKINAHNSKIPLFKGCKPLEKSFKTRVNIFGITIFNVNKFFDLGKHLLTLKFNIFKNKLIFIIKINLFFILKIFNIFYYIFRNVKKLYMFNQYNSNIIFVSKKIK